MRDLITITLVTWIHWVSVSVQAANIWPTMSCSTSLGEKVCMQLDGTTGANAVFSFKPCESNEFCDYKNVETFQTFQRKDSAYSIPAAVRKKAYWVNRTVNRQNLLPGASCDHDYECRSGRCDGQCKGHYNDESCLTDEDWEDGYYCYTNSTVSKTCQKELAAGVNCTEGTDVCTHGYFCTNVGSAGAKCIELFSLPDGTPVTQANVCQGGYKTTGNVCYTVKNVVDTAGTTALSSPYSCDISSGISSWKAFDATNTSVSNTIPCLCSFTTSTTQGYWAWSGSADDYSAYFSTLKAAIKVSRSCHMKAYKWVLDNNLLSSSYFTSALGTTEGFGNW